MPPPISWQTVWNAIPLDFTQPVAVECPAGGALNAGALWGTDVSTKDSTICVAAVHAGAITAENGGVVVVQRVPGLKEYPSTTRHRVASQAYGPYADAFSVSAATTIAGTTASSQPTESLEARLAAVAERIAVLEQQNAELRQFIATNGSALEIRADGNISLEASGQLNVRAGTNLNVDAAGSTTIQSTGEATVEAAGTMRLKGTRVPVNAGTRPVARVGDSAAPGPNGAPVVQQGTATLSSE